MSHKIKLIIFFTLILGMPIELRADELKTYDLKVKLKCNVQKGENTDTGNNRWPLEIQSWQFGFLPPVNVIPPLIVGKENFYPPIDNCYEQYFFGKNNMKLLVLNPLSNTVKTSLLFSAASFKGQRSLEIMIGNNRKEMIEVPAGDKFVDFKVDNIFLTPGINEITLFSPERPTTYTTSPTVYNWQTPASSPIKKLMGKPVTIKFKDFSFTNTSATNAKIAKEILGQRGYYLNNGSIEVMMARENEIRLVSQDIDADLEEFSIFALDSAQNNTRLISCFGIDYTGDGIIDDYLYSEDMGTINLFEMAKYKWKGISEYTNVFCLKKIISVVLPQREIEHLKAAQEEPVKIKNQKKVEKKIDKIYNLTLKDINLFSTKYVTLVKREIGLEQLKIDAVNVLYEVRAEKDWITFFTYFKSSSFLKNIYDVYEKIIISNNNIESIEYKTEKDKKTKNNGLWIYIPLDKTEADSFPFLSFTYDLDSKQPLEIQLALVVTGLENEETIVISSDKYNDSYGRIEVNLKSLIPEGFYAKDLIVIFKQKDNSNLLGQEEEPWHKFKIKDIKQYNIIPYPIKSHKTKERFSRFLEQVNPDLLKINEKIFRFNDFERTADIGMLEKGILSKRIELPSGDNSYREIKNLVFDCEWAILEPVQSSELKVKSQEEPQITFKKINPTKYLVRVDKAKGPFWLVFSESFHNSWKIFLPEKHEEKNKDLFNETIASYPKLGVKEAKHVTGIVPQDVYYLFKKPLDIGHYLVNDYANGWYIEPKQLGLGEDFSVIIYFFPQSYFYLGLAISILTLLGCLACLTVGFFKRKFGNVKK